MRGRGKNSTQSSIQNRSLHSKTQTKAKEKMSAETRRTKILRIAREMDTQQDWLNDRKGKYQPPDHCCPSCACPGYSQVVDLYEINAAELAALLRKDNQPELANKVSEMIADYFSPMIEAIYK